MASRGELHLGVAGWKFFGPLETPTPDTWLETPSFIVDALRDLAGPNGRVVNATRLLMDASGGLRAINEIEQIAQFEFAACHASEAVKRVLLNVRPGMREFRSGKPHAADRAAAELPSDACFGQARPPRSGEPKRSHQSSAGKPFCVASRRVGRADLPGRLDDRGRERVTGRCRRLPRPSRRAILRVRAEWYETVGIGVSGGEIDALVKRHLGDPFSRNPQPGSPHPFGRVDEFADLPRQ